MELSGFTYAFEPWYAGSMGTISKGNAKQADLYFSVAKVEICGTHMLHLDHLGETPF